MTLEWNGLKERIAEIRQVQQAISLLPAHDDGLSALAAELDQSKPNQLRGLAWLAEAFRR